jgi:hypothetical protein
MGLSSFFGFFIFSFDCARYNKDNYILAVQAVDSIGHTSLPVLAV